MMEELYYENTSITPCGVKTFFKQHVARRAAINKLIAVHQIEFDLLFIKELGET